MLDKTTEGYLDEVKTTWIVAYLEENTNTFTIIYYIDELPGGSQYHRMFLRNTI